jgi:hypothetical protein
MSKTHGPYNPDQLLLPPPSLNGWLSGGHLAYFVSHLVDKLDLSAIEQVHEREKRLPSARLVDDGEGPVADIVVTLDVRVFSLMSVRVEWPVSSAIAFSITITGLCLTALYSVLNRACCSCEKDPRPCPSA